MTDAPANPKAPRSDLPANIEAMVRTFEAAVRAHADDGGLVLSVEADVAREKLFAAISAIRAGPDVPAPDMSEIERLITDYGDANFERAEYRRGRTFEALLHAVFDLSARVAAAEAERDEARKLAPTPCQWQPIETAPEDEHIILATTGGHVGEAVMLIDEDTGTQKWTWACGPVHPSHRPLGWMRLPQACPEKVIA